MNFFKKSRIKTPLVLQMETSECGAAALGIILAYYGRYVPLEELRVACGVSRDGSKAINMVKAARLYGLIAQGVRGEPETLPELKFPFIVFWQFNHFVVVEDIQPDLIFINDPAIGRSAISPKEFNRSFTGIVLEFEPGPDFKPGGAPPNIYNSIEERLKGSKLAIIYIILASLTLVFPGIVIPGLSKVFIDEILVQQQYNWLVLLLLGIFLTALLRSLLEFLLEYHIIRLHLKVMLSQSARFLWHCLRLPIAFFEQRTAGDIESRIASNESMASLIADDISKSAVEVFNLILYAIVMFLLDWRLSVIGIIATSFNAVLLYFASDRLQNINRVYVQEEGKLAGLEMNMLAAIETVKSSALDNHLFKRLTGNHAKIIQTEQGIELTHLVLLNLPLFISGFCMALILGVGSFRIMEGFLTVGTLVAFQSIYQSFNEPIHTLLGVGSKIQEIRGEIIRLDDVQKQACDPRYLITEEVNEASKEMCFDAEQMPPTLLIQDLSFGYSPLDPPILENISLSLAPGQRIAVVGETGAGKSTLLKLIAGFYEPWQGEILIGNQNLKSLTPSELASLVSFVDQDIVFFEGSLRDNLTLWDDSIHDEQLIKACQDAEIWEVIESRDKMLDTAILENAQNFSAGERQRLEIARALVHNPKILILDEGTSSLDSITEYKIQKNLRNRSLSLFFITHRLNVIQKSDNIIVIEQGKIIEQGSHEQLMRQEGKYRELYDKSLFS